MSEETELVEGAEGEEMVVDAPVMDAEMPADMEADAEMPATEEEPEA